MIYEVNLDSNNLMDVAQSLRDHAAWFEAKVLLLLERLADLGIDVARINEGDFSGYILYSKEIKGKDGDYEVRMIAKDREKITSVWLVNKGNEQREEVISPLLMAEYGSGHFAVDGIGGGQGTLNKYGHAFDANGWYWWSMNEPTDSEAFPVAHAQKTGATKYHSFGVHPSEPLHKAVMACIEQVDGIVSEVFS